MFYVLNEKNVVVFKTKKLSQGLKDVIRYSCYNVEFIEQEFEIGQTIEVPLGETLEYKLGDKFFVYHHEKNFEVTGFHEVTKADGTKHMSPVSTELNPSNPKLPLLLVGLGCQYPLLP